MRTNFLLFCIIILVICLWFILHQTNKTKNRPLEIQVANTNQQIVQQSRQPKTSQNSARPRPTFTATNQAASRTIFSASNDPSLSLTASWQGHINFYGRVVDENGSPVANATASFHWVETPSKEGNRSASVTADANGFFLLTNQLGLNLSVSVSKAGYYSSREDNNSFNYGSLAGEPFRPDSMNPVVFHLRKKGVGESLIKMKRNYRIPRDGTPVSINLMSGANIPSENGDFVVRCWTQDDKKQSNGKYDWRCVVSIPGGGAVTNNDEFPFEAPENGYAPSLEIAMPADSPDWLDDVNLKFYYRLADGHYGRMTFSMIAGGQHFCMIDSVLNPSGSRNLEPTP